MKLSSNGDLDRWLGKKGVECLRNADGDEVGGFDTLVHGGRYTLGPNVPLPQQQQQRHQNVAAGVFVLYHGDDEDAEPIGTAFAIAEHLLLTACQNVVVSETTNGEPAVVTTLKVTPKLVKSAAGKISTDEGQRGVSVHVHKYNTQVDWACLICDESSATFPFIVPVATSDSDVPTPASTEKLFIYHCPVQLFLDDADIDVCHVMVMEASVGLVSKKTINFQNGGFPGSCGGPYIFRNKAVALHVDSVSTTKTADDIKRESIGLGRKRKLKEAEVTRMVADSCASSHSRLGTGITLHVRSGIMELLQE